MKTTIELPDHLFRRAKSTAAECGQSLKELVTEALQEKLASKPRRTGRDEPAWMEGFGRLRRLHAETDRVNARVEEAFEIVEREDRT